MKVVVVGAGAAGLATLHALRGAGVDAMALEAAGHVGGRLAGERVDGFVLDAGAQFFFRHYETTFALCRELGLGEDIVPFPMRMAMARGGVLHPVTVGWEPRALWRARGDLWRFRGMPASALWQFARVLPLLLRRNRDLHFIRGDKALDLDDESLADFARRRCGDDALEHLFQPVVTAMTLGAPEDIGAAYGLALLWYSLTGLYTLRGGIGSLASALHARHAGHVRLNTPVQRILVEDGRVRGVVTDSGTLAADAVVCATTATRALALVPELPEALRARLGQVTYSTCCHGLFGVPAGLLPASCYAIGLPRRLGSPLAGITDDARKFPGCAPPGRGLLHAFAWGDHARALNALDEAEASRRLAGEIRRFLPAMPGQPLWARVRRWPEAVCLAPPGMLRATGEVRRQQASLGAGPGLAADGPAGLHLPGLYLAGEYLYMPSVDGALRSGLDAAGAVLRQAGREPGAPG
jgi:oxygen-dependent protoporphyrinogen oxidase